MHMAVAILRVEKGLDYSRTLGEVSGKQAATEEQRIIQSNDSTTDLLANSQVNGSNESLSRNASQGKRKCIAFIKITLNCNQHISN